MRTYTDAHIRAVLAGMVSKSSYRKTAAVLGCNWAQLNRIVLGKEPLSEAVALALGFVPRERKWEKQ
jgi:hypothetical protein